ncbi:MAG: ABC transporter permease [Gemmatimonadota bacterium]|jgi:predicted permease
MRDWVRWVREYLELPAMTDRRDERIVAELAAHLEEIWRRARAGGATEAEAEARVLSAIGDREEAVRELLAAERHHAAAEAARRLEAAEERIRGRSGRWLPLADVLRDVRFALRGLAKRPVFSGIVLLVVALGIGATTAIFTLVDGVVLSPLPFEGADRLVSIHHLTADGSDFGQCAAWHFTYADENRSFDGLGMYTSDRVAITGTDAPESVPAVDMTAGVFAVLGVRPVIGRLFGPADEDPDGPATVVLSRGYWQMRFGSDPSVIGRTLQVDGVTREIIGVAPAEAGILGNDPSVFVPLRYRRADLFVGNVGYGSVARLREDVTVEQAQRDLARLLPLAYEKFPGGPVADSNDRNEMRPALEPYKASIVGSAAGLLWLLLGGVAVVLLIVCANVANLFLVRAEEKRTEMAVRTALGASARRVGWEYMKESLVVGVLGGIAGLMLAGGGLRLLTALSPDRLPRMDEVAISPTVVLFAFALAVSAGVFFGLLPAWRHSRGALGNMLRQQGRGGGDRHRVQNVLAVTQVALALLLLVASGLMIRSFLALQRVDPGFHDPDDVLSIRLYIPGGEIRDPAGVALAYEQIAERLAAIPGVAAVSPATAIPMDGGGNINPFYVEGRRPEEVRTLRHKWIGEGYFEGLGIRLVAGRAFTWADVHDRIAGALVSESLAREVWGSSEAALGQGIAARPDPPRWYRVIGVAADVREDGMDREPPLMIYWPQVTVAFWQGNPADQINTWRSSAFAVRSPRVGSAGFRDEIRRAVWSVNPNLPLMNVRTLRDAMAASVSRRTFTLVLLAIAGAVALIVGLVGVYGVIAYAVSRRTHELGMRLAIGAEPGRLLAMVLRQGLALSLIGVGIGLVLAFALTRLMEAQLFGVRPVDPLTYLVVAVGLTGVVLLATWVPARRAARIDPGVALRAE